MKTFIIQQKVKFFANHYLVYEGNGDGEKGNLVAYAQQKPLAFKEKVTFYTDETKNQVAFNSQARSVIDFGARYDVSDAEGKPIGTLGKAFKASLLRSTWHLYQPGQEETPFIIARERNQTLAIVRRIWELIPYIGDIPFFVKYHFDFIDSETEKVLATYNKTTTFRDHYRLEIEDELLAKVDWRPLVALGIMMDALQSR